MNYFIYFAMAISVTNILLQTIEALITKKFDVTLGLNLILHTFVIIWGAALVL